MTIDPKTGKVTVPKDAAAGATFMVTARATDGSGTKKSKQVTIKERATSVTIDPTSVTTIATHESGVLGTSITLSAHTDNGEDVGWEISDSSVATLVADGNTATVAAVKAGDVTVSATAQDGSGKKATLKIKVVVPVSDITLVPEKNRMENILASGGTLQFYANCGDKYGKPTNSKVEWSYELVCYSSNMKDKEVPLSDELREMIRKDKAIFTFKNGKITAAKQKDFEKQWFKYWQKGAGKDYGILVTATATDGTGLSATKLVRRVDQNKSLYLLNEGFKELNLSPGAYTLTGLMVFINHDPADMDFYITNSNPDVVECKSEVTGKYKYVYLYFYANKPGVSTVTIKTMDGSNLTYKLKVKVTKQ